MSYPQSTILDRVDVGNYWSSVLFFFRKAYKGSSSYDAIRKMRTFWRKLVCQNTPEGYRNANSFFGIEIVQQRLKLLKIEFGS